ncbi:hypothetical protein PQO01_15280 [Lentisphaera marina]|uniref:EI24 domain-containing protein n=1 Tax=Lentisphaera marina TaxID=1111041 RepID=UPI0023650889|nr:hypothetical protein [Lentisphaera marina]MDD7986312.1 hypothetical protein [Lentisphaera marina]
MEPSGQAQDQQQKELILSALSRVIAKENSLSLLKGGLKLFSRDKQLFAKYAFGVTICLFASVSLCVLFYFIFQAFGREPLEAMVQGNINWPNWLSWLSTPEQWIRDFGGLIILAISYLIIVYLSVRLAFLFMIYWTDEMIASVMKISRNRPNTPFSVRWLLRLLKTGLRLTLRTLGVTLLFFCLSWIPFIGYPIFLLGVAWSSGKDIMATVVMVYAEEEIEIPNLCQMPFKDSARLGWLFCVVYSVPLIGILFMPLLYILQVCAFTFAVECEMRNLLGVNEQGNKLIS